MPTEIAKAYIQLVPTMQGVKQALTKDLGGEAANAGKFAGGDFTKAFGGELGNVGKLASSSLGELSSSFASGIASVAAYGAAVAAVAVELVKLSNEAAKHADSIKTMSTNYGIAISDIQKLKYMEELTDVSTETLLGSMSRLTRSMSSAQSGTGATADAFSRLGVSVTNSDGSLRSSNTVFMEAIDALGSVGNATERDALAMEIFGRSAMELNSVIAQGSDGLRALAQEAENSGYVMSDKMVNLLAEGDDAGQRFNKAMEGLGNTIGAVVTPSIIGWEYVLTQAADSTATFIQRLTGLRDEADQVTDAINTASDALSNFSDITPRDLMSQQQKDYVRYLGTMDEYYKSLGISSGYVQDFDLWSENQQRMRNGQSVVYDSGRSMHVTFEIDGKKIAQATYDANRAESNRIGNHAIR